MSTPDPVVSIVMPVRNGMPWLPDAVGSVVGQEAAPSVELIVLDGGSTDGSREWLSAHASTATLIFESDKGQTDALARGFALAKGRVLGWLNADDVYEPRALRTVMEAFERRPLAAAISGSCRLIDELGRDIELIPRVADTSRSGLLASIVNLPQPATLFRRDAYEAAGGIDRSLVYAMDVDLWLRLATQLGGIVLIPDLLARFRIHPGAKTQAAAAATLREDLRVRRRYGLGPSRRAFWSLLKRGHVEPRIRAVLHLPASGT